MKVNQMSKCHYWFVVALTIASVALNIAIHVFSNVEISSYFLIESTSIVVLTLFSILAALQLFCYLFSCVQVLYGALQLYSFVSILRHGFGASFFTFLQSPLLLIAYLIQLVLCVAVPAYILLSSQFHTEMKDFDRQRTSHILYFRVPFVIVMLLVGILLVMNLMGVIGSAGEHD